MQDKHRFLLISGDPAITGLVENCAGQGAWSLDTAPTGAQGFKAVLAAKPDLVIVDIAVPDMDGLAWLEILREMREGRDLPVMVVGAKLGPEQMARGFELGADDCVALHHCDPREFSARIRAVLRRRSPRAEQPAAPMKTGPVELDPGAHRCFVNGAEVALRPREFELLETLMRRAGRVLSRPYLLESVWGMASSADTRAVDVTVSRLRKALGKEAGAWIVSVERFGYRFSDPGGFQR